MSESVEMTEMAEGQSPSRENDPKTRKAVIEDNEARRNYLVGIGLLLLVVLLWTSSSFLTQVRIFPLLEHVGAVDRIVYWQDLYEGGYEKPFL
jgi:solute carrier family 35, member F5